MTSEVIDVSFTCIDAWCYRGTNRLKYTKEESNGVNRLRIF